MAALSTICSNSCAFVLMKHNGMQLNAVGVTKNFIVKLKIIYKWEKRF